MLENLDAGRQKPRRHSDGTPAPEWTPETLFRLFPNLAEMRHRPGGRMSGGEQQMLTIARTLMGNPLLVLLDEPSEGIAPLIVEQVADTIVEAEKARAVDPVLGAECRLRRDRVGPRLHAGEGTDPLVRNDGGAFGQHGNPADVPHAVTAFAAGRREGGRGLCRLAGRRIG